MTEKHKIILMAIVVLIVARCQYLQDIEEANATPIVPVSYPITICDGDTITRPCFDY